MSSKNKNLYIAIGLFVLDRIFEMIEKESLSKEDIKARLPGEIEGYFRDRAQMDQEIEQYGGDQ